MVLLLLAVFVLGAVTAVAVEAVGLWIILRRLTQKVEREEIRAKDAASVLYDDLSSSLHEKQGALWVLESEKVPKSWCDGKLPEEQRRRKDILEVSPVNKYVKLKDRCLILTESYGSQAKISLKRCKIAAVSATSLSQKNGLKGTQSNWRARIQLYIRDITLFTYILRHLGRRNPGVKHFDLLHVMMMTEIGGFPL